MIGAHRAAGLRVVPAPHPRDLRASFTPCAHLTATVCHITDETQGGPDATVRMDRGGPGPALDPGSRGHRLQLWCCQRDRERDHRQRRTCDVCGPVRLELELRLPLRGVVRRPPALRAHGRCRPTRGLGWQERLGTDAPSGWRRSMGATWPVGGEWLGAAARCMRTAAGRCTPGCYVPRWNIPGRRHARHFSRWTARCPTGRLDAGRRTQLASLTDRIDDGKADARPVVGVA